MESWNFGCEGKGFGLSDEIDHVHATNTALVMGCWDIKTPFDYDNSRVDSGQDVYDNHAGFSDLGFSDLATKSVSDTLFGGVLDGKMVDGIVSSPTCVSNSKELSLGESSSRFSSNVGDSNCRDSSLIDLKLGRLTDYRNGRIGESSKNMARTSSEPEKRARVTSFNSPIPVCQVYGCNMDLSNSKEYHKRHKVCDTHSKTPKVIVNGIEQRFCQQCSRFHLLVEFDNDKRSCRKRLAGHNERRRKPQVDCQTARSRKLHLPPYNGTRFPGISLPAMTTCMSPNISSIMQPVKYENSNWFRQVKLEHLEYSSPHSVPPVTNHHFLPRPCGPLYGVEKQFPFLHGTGVDICPRSNYTENNNHYAQNLINADTISRFRPWTSPSGREDVTVCDAASTIHGVSGASYSRSAFSLLSSPSQNSSSQSSGIPITQPLLIQGNHACHNLDQLSEKLLGLSSQASTSSVSNRYSSSVNYDRVEPIVTSDASNSFKFDVRADEIFQGSEFVSTKDPLSPEHTTTVNLLQLSSQLQRVEQQRHSMQVREEDDTFFRLPFT